MGIPWRSDEYLRLSNKAVCIGKSVQAFIWVVMARLPSGDRARWFLFPRKVSQGEWLQIVPITDTGGLVEKTQGSEWDMLKEFGKLSGRTLARCPPRLPSGGRGAAKDCGGTVYQKHRSVQTRKRRYTGWNLPSAGRLSAWVVRSTSVEQMACNRSPGERQQ